MNALTVAARFKAGELSLLEKLRLLNWPFVLIVALVALAGYGMLYSAAGGSPEPWAWRHSVRFCIGVPVMLAIALIDVRFWFRWAYLIYAAALLGLIAVE
ncbi:MAG: rodA, partial [Geminicoccaceae bacterium]|nr:rodA [Geminicoccaceae bacterium]